MHFVLTAKPYGVCGVESEYIDRPANEILV